jgi:hypothetical protein
MEKEKRFLDPSNYWPVEWGKNIIKGKTERGPFGKTGTMQLP